MTSDFDHLHSSDVVEAGLRWLSPPPPRSLVSSIYVYLVLPKTGMYDIIIMPYFGIYMNMLMSIQDLFNIYEHGRESSRTPPPPHPGTKGMPPRADWLSRTAT